MFAKNVLYLFCIVCVFILSACGTTSSVQRGKLSEAMAKSSDDYQGTRNIESNSQPYEPSQSVTDTESVIDSTDTSDTHITLADNNDSSTGMFHIGSMSLSMGQGSISGKQYEDHSRYYLSLGYKELEQYQFDLFAGYELIKMNSRETLIKSVGSDVAVLTLGVKLIHFFMPSSYPIRPYMQGGLAGSSFSWTYSNSFKVDNSIEITGDSVAGVSIHLGAGISFQPIDSVRITAEASPRLHIWGDTTDEGFENDIFGITPLADLSLSTTILF